MDGGESGFVGPSGMGWTTQVVELCVITGNKRISFLRQHTLLSLRKTRFNYTRISEFIHNGDLIS